MRMAFLLLAGLFALSAPVFAGIDEPLLVNGCFGDGSAGWEYSENVIFGEFGGRPDTAYDPWPYPGASGYIRQVVDNSKSPFWDPNLNHKIEVLEFDLYTTGEGYVQIGFDWWDQYWGDTKPIGQAPFFEILPTQFTSVGQWTRYAVEFDFYGKPGATWQPRWTSIEIYFFGCYGDNEAGIDDLVLTSRCVPEPSSMLALSGSLLGLAGFVLRRRR